MGADGGHLPRPADAASGRATGRGHGHAPGRDVLPPVPALPAHRPLAHGRDRHHRLRHAGGHRNSHCLLPAVRRKVRYVLAENCLSPCDAMNE